MRGQIRIASQRSPYRRAGLAWATREAHSLDIRELDGPRLLALLEDPVLTLSLGQEDATFKPFPALDETVTAEKLQGIIDALAAELPPMGADAHAPAPAAGWVEQQLLEAQASSDRQAAALDAARKRDEALAEQLAAAGFTSVELLISAHTTAGDQASRLGRELRTANDTIATLTNERDGATSRVIELEREVAQLKAVPPAKAPKPKPAGTDKAS